MATRTVAARRSRRLSASPYPVPFRLSLSPPPPRDEKVYVIDREAQGSAAASDKAIQREFGQLLGIVEDCTRIPEDYSAITDEEATLIAVAASHVFDPLFFSKVCDGYFTITELKRAAVQHSHGESVTLCDCRAHRFLKDPTANIRNKEDIAQIIRSKEPLTDDDGKEFAEAVVRLILDLSKAEGKIRQISLGSEYAVSYVLLQGSQVTHYSGYPNHIVKRPSGVGAAIILTGVGETQSDNKDAVLQGGIYAVGEFRKPESKHEIACIALHKNKSMNVMVAKLDTGCTPATPSLVGNVLGRVTYKYVVNTVPLNLKVAETVGIFANRLVKTLK